MMANVCPRREVLGMDERRRKNFFGQDPLAGLVIPAELEGSFRRHRENLARLVVTLRSAGLSEEKIEESVSVIVASYESELLRTIKSMMR